VVSETVAADRGIGYMMIAASSRFDVPLERRYIGGAVRGLEQVA
jgi:hypothetical protein